MLFIINVNVLFLSNSQPAEVESLSFAVVYHQCQCSLFKQFTTVVIKEITFPVLFIINVNVLFLSNSQQKNRAAGHTVVVYHQCQCSLFKQFTTLAERMGIPSRLFIINVNVLFLSNSQPDAAAWIWTGVVYHQCQCSLFKQFTTFLLPLPASMRCLSSMSMFSF